MLDFVHLGKNRNFILLWTGQVISQFGDRLNQMALIALIYARFPGSTFEMGKLLFFTIAPVFIVGPMAGVYVDRWNRKLTMIVCDIGRGLLTFLIPLFFAGLKPMFPIYVTVFLVFSLTRFFLPCKLAMVPDIVMRRQLLTANSLLTTTGMIATIIGFGLSGLLVEWYGTQSGFYINALSYFLSAAAIALMTVPGKGAVSNPGCTMHTEKHSLTEDVRQGISFIRGHREFRFVTAITFIVMAGTGVIYVLAIVFVQQYFHSTTKHLGLLAMLCGTGLFLGTIIYGMVGKRISRANVMFACLVLGGIAVAGFVLLTRDLGSFLVAGILAVIVGACSGPILVATNTMMHESVPGEMRGRVFGALEIIIHIAFLLFMVLSSVLAEHVDRGWIIANTGIALSVCGLSGFIYGLKNNRRCAIR
jgi:MFS family permease